MMCLLALAGGASVFLIARSRSVWPPPSRTSFVAPSAPEFGPRHGPHLQLARSAAGHQLPRLTAVGVNLPANQASGNIALPIAFEPSQGQVASQAQFVGRGMGMTVLLTNSGLAVRAGRGGSLGIRFETKTQRRRKPKAASPIVWRGDEKLRGETNYLIGKDRRAWRTSVPHFGRVKAANVAPGVGMSVYGNDRGIEYDLRIAAGADVTKLRLRLDGAGHADLNDAGDLSIRTGEDMITMRKPQVYEDSGAGDGSQRRSVASAYVLEPDGSIGFRLGSYDRNSTLVIDPSLSVAYASFLGGAGSDTAASIALDSFGKIYVGGVTTSDSTFPEFPQNRIGPADGPSEFFIAKIDPTVSGPDSLIYLTFLGGSGTQTGGQIAVDSAGDVAITGATTSFDFPVTDATGPTNGLMNGTGNDVIVSEIDPTGTNLVFSTLFGGSGKEFAQGTGGIAFDSTGSVYVASDTGTTSVDPASPDLPVSAGAFGFAWDGQKADGFLAMFRPPSQAGGAATLKYCSYLGTNSSGVPGVGGLAVDKWGNVYVAGFSENTVNGFPWVHAFQSAYGGGTSDAFLMKILPKGNGSNDVVYATLLGGAGMDQALGVAVDSATTPNAYVTGVTSSATFPESSAKAGYQGALQPGATSNAFVAVISQDAGSGATSLAYLTFLGGSSADSGQGIALAAPNAVYITGNTRSNDFPWRDNLQPFNGAGDAFVAKLDPTTAGAASLIYATPLGGMSPVGGSASATGASVAADGAGHAYVAGATTSSSFPTAVTTDNPVNGFQPSCASCSPLNPASDAFVAEIAENATNMAPSVRFNLPRLVFTAGSIAPALVGILNSGEANLVISDVSIAGPNAVDFSLSGQSPCLNQPIAPGPQLGCSFEVAFHSTTVGPEVAVLSVTDNAPGSPQMLEMTGAGGDGPLVAVWPTAVGFGSQPQNTKALNPAVVTLTNVGDQSLMLSSFNLGGLGAAQFVIESGGANGIAPCQSGTPLTQGASCAVQVAFNPSGQGFFRAELDFFDTSANSANAEQVVLLTGTGVAAAPIANASPAALSFGGETVGSASGPQSVSLTNSGSAALSLTSIAVTGSDAADFTIAATGTNCPLTGGVLAISAGCTVAVQFAPQTAGSKNASLSFTDNAAGNPQQVSLSGSATPAPSLSVSPASLAFGPQGIGTTSASQIVTVSNNGGAAAGIGVVSVSGANATDFSASAAASCTSIPAQKSCPITVTFIPSATFPPGARSATLSVAGATPPTVALSGTATQAAVSTPPSVNFGAQLSGTKGSAVPIAITNSSNGPYAGTLAISSVSVAESGGLNGDFAVAADNCTGSSTAPGQACSIQLVFQPASVCPTTTGTRTATLTINDNAPGSPQTVALSGSAVDFCINVAQGQGVATPVPAGTPETFNFQIASSDASSGSAQLACAVPAAMLGGCTIATTPATTPPAVQISSTNPGLFQMTVTSTAPGTASGPISTTRKNPPWPLTGVAAWLVPALLGSVIFLSWARREERPRMAPASLTGVVLGVLLAISVGMAACGGGGGAAVSDPAPGTPPGNYNIVITATITVTGQGSITRTWTEVVQIQ